MRVTKKQFVDLALQLARATGQVHVILGEYGGPIVAPGNDYNFYEYGKGRTLANFDFDREGDTQIYEFLNTLEVKET